jgi:hypothetical protein
VLSLRKGGNRMSAVDLKKKLRNFPSANLTIRVVGS